MPVVDVTAAPADLLGLAPLLILGLFGAVLMLLKRTPRPMSDDERIDGDW